MLRNETKTADSLRPLPAFVLFIPCLFLWVTIETSMADSAQEFYKRAEAKSRIGDLDGARIDLDRVIDLDSKNAQAYNDRGCVKAAQGDWDGAITDYTHAIRLGTTYVVAYRKRDMSVVFSGNFNSDKGYNDDNLVLVLGGDKRDFIIVHPKDAIFHCNRGRAMKMKGDLDSAIADLNYALDLNPSCVEAYRERGWIEEGKGNLDRALANHNFAIKLSPKHAKTYEQRAYLHLANGDQTHALADLLLFCDLSDKDQDYPHLYIWLIRTRLNEKKDADKQLSAYFEKRSGASPLDWVFKVAGFLLDEVTEAHLFASTFSPDAEKTREQLCEAWYYSGMKKLLSGDKKTAASYFRECLATEQKNFVEYRLARAELRSLGD